jgi:hypothetical protein
MTINASAKGAVVIKHRRCTLLASNGSTLFSTRAKVQAVKTPSGNSKLTCHAQQPSRVPGPGHAVEFNYQNTGFTCFTFFGNTRDWKEVVTPSGHATLVCHLHKK